MAAKKLKKYLKKKKDEKQTEELRNFENIKLSDDEKSDKSSSSKSGKNSTKGSELDDNSVWSSVGSINNQKLGLDENFVILDIRKNRKKLKLENEVFHVLTTALTIISTTSLYVLVLQAKPKIKTL